MPHIDAVLLLYPDTATRHALLELAWRQSRADLADLRAAILVRDYAMARQHAHRAKGTASFLGSGTLLPFDRFTDALRTQDIARVAAAFAPVEAALLELVAMLEAQLHKMNRPQ